MTYYQVLGVAPDASTSEVRQAYLRLARVHHPDRHAEADVATRESARRRMQEINMAWSVLGDQSSRRTYDQRLASAPPPPPHPDDEPEPWPPGPPDVGPPVTGIRRVLAMAPVLLLAAAVVIGWFGLVVGEAAVLALAGMCGFLAVIFFAVAPLVALTDARKNG